MCMGMTNLPLVFPVQIFQDGHRVHLKNKIKQQTNKHFTHHFRYTLSQRIIFLNYIIIQTSTMQMASTYKNLNKYPFCNNLFLAKIKRCFIQKNIEAYLMEISKKNSNIRPQLIFQGMITLWGRGRVTFYFSSFDIFTFLPDNLSPHMPETPM